MSTAAGFIIQYLYSYVSASSVILIRVVIMRQKLVEIQGPLVIVSGVEARQQATLQI